MTTHLSTRITWHDRGWDGHVCDCPVENSSCLVHQHIRESRNDAREMESRGRPLRTLDGWLPPCSRDANAFSAETYRIRHHDPLEWRSLPPVDEELPPFSVSPAPYRWMREEQLRDIVDKYQIDLVPPEDRSREHGWVNEPKRQRQLLTRFWDELETGRSLVFFYCNHGNPIEGGPARIIVGASRVSDLGELLIFPNKHGVPPNNPVWSRRVSHAYPTEGIRLPLQEYLRAGRAVDDLVCTVPGGGMVAFSYVAEHVSDDLAVGALEQLLHAVEAVKRDAIVSGDWDRALAWIDDALEETWTGRGLLPGVGSVFRALGMERGLAFQRAEFADPSLSRRDLWDKALALLKGARLPYDQPAFYNSLKRARDRWRALPEARRDLLALLARFELTVDQVTRLSEPRKRAESGIDASEAEIIANPYVLFEQDHGSEGSAAIALDTVDRGVVMDPGRWSGEGSLALDDISRVRATAVAVLEETAEAGDTFLALEELLDRVERRFPERRRCATDIDLILGSEDFIAEALHIERDHEPPLVALPRLREAERLFRELVERRWRRVAEVASEPDWGTLIANQFRETGATALAPDLEERAQREKVEALRLLYRRRISVLTGRAGTGKTSVVRALLDGIEMAEGRQNVLLLAPTGKARVRLRASTRRPAQTIHQFLLRNQWLDKDTLRIRLTGGKRQGAPTVIVDEASMIPIDLLGALCAGLDLNVVKRLIFVGDPNQLPPIGPGRPFVDLIAWLQDEQEAERRACIAELAERARHEDASSRALQLADGYLRDSPPSGSDELLAEVAQRKSGGDLEVEFYDSPSELRTTLWKIIDRMVDAQPREAAHAAFTRSLGGAGPTGERAEAWQLLSPVRVGSSGTDDLNRQIQQRFKSGLLNSRPGRKKTSFGDEDIVWTDKVIQVRNRGRLGWPRKTGADYVANGEMGVVVETDRDGKYLDVAYSTQHDVTYRYWGNDVNDELRLAYAVTVHKAQGSDFDTVVLLLPAGAATLSRELLYTALTRFRKRLILLVEKDVSALVEFRRPERSDVTLRNTNLFEPQLRPEEARRPFAHRLIHQASDGSLVRSKSELVVIETLLGLDISVDYERRLEARERLDDFRLPDFTVSFEGEVYYWEHLGMLDVASYARSWARKRRWYEDNGYLDRVITSADGGGGGLRVPEIEQRARRRIIRGDPRGPDEPGFD